MSETSCINGELVEIIGHDAAGVPIYTPTGRECDGSCHACREGVVSEVMGVKVKVWLKRRASEERVYSREVEPLSRGERDALARARAFEEVLEYVDTVEQAMEVKPPSREEHHA